MYLFDLSFLYSPWPPEDKKVVYVIVAFIIMVAVLFIISAILMAIFGGMIGYGISNGSYHRFGM